MPSCQGIHTLDSLTCQLTLLIEAMDGMVSGQFSLFNTLMQKPYFGFQILAKSINFVFWAQCVM